ncbi:interferon-induced very large GTPase 1-like [Alosa pseudoharengus]|uniref:interferon-induced very large GTPase 1-like n=1 Tax=Alosa pseudoharengus TaxID=34774 RepID=UPI003F88C0F7
MESLSLVQVKKNLIELENLVKEGKDQNDAKVKDMEDKIRIALDVPRESWMNTGQTLKDVIEKVHKLLDVVQDSTVSSEIISDKDVLENASGGLALEGVYKTRNSEDLLKRREQLIEIPDSFSLSGPVQSTRYEQKEFSSHKSEAVYHKVMEKLGHSFSSSLNIGFKGFGFGSGVEKNKSNEMEQTSSNLQEESYILHTKYNYVPLACGILQKDELKLSSGAVNTLREIENVILLSNDRKTQTNTIRSFYERFGSHVNQGPVHFGGVFWWRASSSGFRSNDVSEIKQLISESLNVYSSAGFGFGALSISAKVATSSTQLRGSLTGKHREDLMSNVQLSVSKTGGPAEIDNHLQWKVLLTANNRTWSIIDRGTTLTPIWEILMSSHRDDFNDVSNLGRILMEAYTDITGENVEEVWGENILSEMEKAETLMQSVKTWSATDCESYLAQLLDFKTWLFEKTRSHKIWLKCLSNEILQNYLFEVATVNSKSTAVNLRCLIRSLLEDHLNEVENFQNRRELMNWAYLTEEDLNKQGHVSHFSELDRVFQCAKQKLGDSRLMLSSAEQEGNAKMKTTMAVTLSLNSFCKTLQEKEEKEVELLVLSIITVIGYSREHKTFDHVLNIKEITFLQSELQSAFSRYTSLKEQCSIRAQAYLLLTALTVSTDKEIQISPKAKEERLQVIQTQLKNKLSLPPKVMEKRHHDWESLESALNSIITGTKMSDGSTVEEVLRQLENISVKDVAPLSELQKTDEQNTALYNKGEKTRSFMNLLQKLGLEDFYPKKMTKSRVLVMDELSLSVKEPQTEKDLNSLYLYKLMTLDYRARYLFVKSEEISMDFEEDVGNVEDDGDDFFDCDDKSDMVMSSKQPQIHPMDLHMAIFHCSSDFLRQYIFTKLSTCQFSLPFLVPNPCTDEVEFPLWALRHIRKTWHSKTASDTSGKYHNRQMFNTPVPIISFIRLGVSDLNSKSQMLDGLISKQKHSVFFHRHCKGSTPDSLLMNGVVEIAWYCPGGKKDDTFHDCVAFLNLHGNAEEHPKQLEFLQAVSTVNVLLLSEHSMSETAKKISQDLSKSHVPLICLFSGKDKIHQSKNPSKVRLAAKNRNQAEFTEELISSIKQCINECKQTASIERCCEEARRLQFKVDEDKQSCQDGHAIAKTLMCLLKGSMRNNLSTLKATILPLQGKLWHEWCTKNKEQYRLQIKNESIAMKMSGIQSEMRNIRQRQLNMATPLNDFMRSFLECLTTPAQFEDTHLYTLQWLRILLDDLTTDELASLEQDYHSTWRKMKNVPKGKDKALYVNPLQNKLDSIINKMAATTVGIQHIMREVSQLYETIQLSTESHKNNVKHATLPKLGVKMLISGYPLELMDGDAAHVPITWINAVLDELINTLKDKKVFVLSILGLQSSGKSTLLNTMFGLQFAVSAGRCTRGAFMQLVKVDSSIRDELGYDYVLIVDTEGLRSPELSTNITLNHDNELATFIIGIGDMTVINIMGENPSEMHDILEICVQAFLRMKQVKITPSCIFVHQNVAESSAGDKNIEGRRRLLEKLDEMAEIAAKQENAADITCFSDVIQFDIETQVFYFKNLLEGDPPMAPPNPSYSQNVHELKSKILGVASWQEKRSFPSLSQLKSRVSDLWTALLQENFVFSFKNTVEMMVYTSLEHKYSEWTWTLRKHSLNLQTKLENQIGSNLIQDVTFPDLAKEFDKVYNPLKTEIERYFREDKNKETLVKWKTKIDIRIVNLKSELIEGTVKKCKELLTSKQNRSELDKKRAKYTDELTKKSKLLASTLKAKHLTDEQMTEEFQKLWVFWTNDVLKSQPPEEALNVKPIVENILHRYFQNQSNIIQKLRGMKEFNFNADEHINQSFLKRKWGKLCGNFDQVNVLRTNTSHTVNKYITTKENDKKDFDENFIYEILSDIDKSIAKFEDTPGHPKLTNEFKVDFSIDLCLKNVSKLQEMHDKFKTANQPLTYLQSQSDTYFQSFKNYCKGASSVTIFVDFLCKHITPEVLNAATNKTSQLIADTMASDHPALNGNRSNLENHILKHLAAQESFAMYEEYIDSPKKFFERFIRENVKEFCDTGKLDTFYQDNLKSMKNLILSASTVVTTEVVEKKGNTILWLDLFCRKVGEIIVIKRDELRSIENEEITDWSFLKDTIARSVEEIIKNKKMDVTALREKPTTILCEQLQGCWAQCPFCKAICTNTIPNHDGDHSVKFHRSQALAGWHKVGTDNFVIDFCTTKVISDLNFINDDDETIPYKTYRKAGPPYNKWSITGDGITQCYWKWFICKFQSEMETKHKCRYTGHGKIPDEWEKHTKESALAELQ